MKKAFTLIELLVVIAIIAILAAILFPVFAQAKLAAKKTQALNNNKQIALATIMYAGDADDTFSYGTAGIPNQWRWQDNWILNTIPYVKNLDIFKSPADTHKPIDWSGPAFSFAGNGMACWDWQSSSDWKTGGIFGHNSQLDQTGQSVTSSTSIALPAETILFAERYKLAPVNQRSGEGDAPRGMYDSNDVVLMGGYKGSVFPGQTAKDGHNCTWTKPCLDGGIYEVANNYTGTSTFTFSDGHAKAMKPEQTIDGNAYVLTNCDSHGYKLWDKFRTQ